LLRPWPGTIYYPAQDAQAIQSANTSSTSLKTSDEVTMAPRSHAPRLSDTIMDELTGDQPWDLDQHLSGCLAGYQTDPSYGAAVYFALEALSGIVHDVEVRASPGTFDSNQLDADWIISPNTKLPVPWIWIRAPNPTNFDHQTVVLEGTAAAVRETTSRKGNDYTTFKLQGPGGCGAVNIFAWGHPALASGDHVCVRGVFETEHYQGGYKFYNEVEAVKVAPLCQ
jgi:hypothetical protein